MKKHLFAFLATLIVLPAVADNWIKFESAAVEDAINTLVAEENRQFAADEFQKQMDQTTGKISVMGIYKVCAAAGKDINTNKGYDDCRYFINQMAEKSGFGDNDATAASCASQMNGVWTLSAAGKTDGKYTETYQCVGRDGHVLVYKKSCSNAGGECIRDFADLKTQGPVGREFIAEYARKKDLNLTCKVGFETRRGVTSPLGQDYIKCSAGDQAYEFEFDSLNETPGKTSVESENRAMCEFFGGKIVKHPDKSIEEVWQSCDLDDEICNGEMHRFALRIGHTNQYQGYCRLSRAVSRVGVATMNQIDGVDSYVFYKSGAQTRADMARVQLEEYLRKTFPGESYINCDPTVKKLEGNGLGADMDYVLTCTVGSRQVDFVFDDLTESNKKRADTGMDAMQCITNGGTFNGEYCRGPTKDECTKLDVALRARGSTEGAKWDDEVRACILGNAMKTYKADVATGYVIGGVVIIGGGIFTIASGGVTTPLVIEGVAQTMGTLIGDVAINIALDANHRRLSKAAANRFNDFVSDAEKCNDEPCALNVLEKHYATLSRAIDDLNTDDRAIVEQTMDKLAGLIQTEFVACGLDDDGKVVVASPSDCAKQQSKLQLIDYWDKASEPVLMLASVIYPTGWVTSQVIKVKKVSNVAENMGVSYKEAKQLVKAGKVVQDASGAVTKADDLIVKEKWQKYVDLREKYRADLDKYGYEEFFKLHPDSEQAFLEYTKAYQRAHPEIWKPGEDVADYVNMSKVERKIKQSDKEWSYVGELDEEIDELAVKLKNTPKQTEEQKQAAVNATWEYREELDRVTRELVPEYAKIDDELSAYRREFFQNYIRTNGTASGALEALDNSAEYKQLLEREGNLRQDYKEVRDFLDDHTTDPKLLGLKKQKNDLRNALSPEYENVSNKLEYTKAIKEDAVKTIGDERNVIIWESIPQEIKNKLPQIRENEIVEILASDDRLTYYVNHFDEVGKDNQLYNDFLQRIEYGFNKKHPTMSKPVKMRAYSDEEHANTGGYTAWRDNFIAINDKRNFKTDLDGTVGLVNHESGHAIDNAAPNDGIIGETLSKYIQRSHGNEDLIDANNIIEVVSPSGLNTFSVSDIKNEQLGQLLSEGWTYTKGIDPETYERYLKEVTEQSSWPLTETTNIKEKVNAYRKAHGLDQ